MLNYLMVLLIPTDASTEKLAPATRRFFYSLPLVATNELHWIEANLEFFWHTISGFDIMLAVAATPRLRLDGGMLGSAASCRTAMVSARADLNDA